jgi:hypothetical protein
MVQGRSFRSRVRRKSEEPSMNENMVATIVEADLSNGK